MKIVFSKHSLERAEERAISEKELRDAIYFPDKIDESSQDNKRFLIKKIYYNEKLKAEHLLMIICEKEEGGVTKMVVVA